MKQEGERREIFLRYLGEVATAVSSIKDYGERSREELYKRLVAVAKRKTAVADKKKEKEPAGTKKQAGTASDKRSARAPKAAAPPKKKSAGTKKTALKSLAKRKPR